MTMSDELVAGGITFQSQYGPFELEKIINYEDKEPGQGVSFGYKAINSEVVTIYIYNKKLEFIPEGPESDVVMEEFVNTIDGIIYKFKSENKNIWLIEKYWTGSPESGKEFLCSQFLVNNKGLCYLTYMYLTVSNNHFVKIRISLRTTDRAVTTARDFVDEIANTLKCVHNIQ